MFGFMKQIQMVSETSASFLKVTDSISLSYLGVLTPLLSLCIQYILFSAFLMLWHLGLADSGETTSPRGS